MNHGRVYLSKSFIIISLILIATAMAIHAQGSNGIPILPVPSGVSLENQIVYFTNTNFQPQSVFYNGEEFNMIINLENVFSGQQVYLTITMSGPSGTQEYSGVIPGGYAYYVPFEIVPPIYNGATYTAQVTACLVVNNAITPDCVSGSANYVEEDHPPATIVGTPYIVNSNNQEVTALPSNNTYRLVVSIENTGYISYTYTVEVSDSAGLISAQPMQVTVPAQGEATINVPIYVKPSNNPISDTITVSVYGDGYLDNSASIGINVLPSRPGPFTIVSVSTTILHEGEQNVITITLQNTGYTASNIEVTAVSNIASNVYAVPSTTQVDSGGDLTVTLYLTPTTAGNGVITLGLTYSWPFGSGVFIDTFKINVTVLTQLTVNLVSVDGTPVNALASINGQETNSLWVTPGTYVISVPGTVSISNDEQYVFDYWSNGYGTSTTITVNVNGPTTLTAYYIKEYYVSITDPVTGKSVSGWFNKGSTVNLPSIPPSISYNNGSRLVFQVGPAVIQHPRP